MDDMNEKNCIAIHPQIPYHPNSMTNKCLNILLAGGTLNRKTLKNYGITCNPSLNSIISILRNNVFIPIMSDEQSDGTCNYFIQPEEIARFHHSTMRSIQISEMKSHVTNKRISKIIKAMLKFLSRLNDSPQFSASYPSLDFRLGEITEKINAFLTKRKGAI